MKLAHQAFAYIFLLLDSFIYGIVNRIYNVYISLARARIFSGKLFSGIANRIYAVIGVVMLFVLAYSIIQGIISPDKMTKGAGSGSEIIKRVLKAVIGLAIVPAVFNLAYRGQDVILKNDVIGKIFLGFNDEGNIIQHGTISIDDQEISPPSDVNQNDGLKSQAGTVTSLSIWQAFFYPTDTESEDAASKIEANDAPIFVQGTALLTKFGCGIAVLSILVNPPAALLATATICSMVKPTDDALKLATKVTNLEQAYGAAAGSGVFSYFPAFAKNVANGEIQYHFGLSTLAGIACAYLFLSFAIDMGVRAAKLAFLELIAPIPLMMQIMPNSQETYTKWYKNCLSLFFEVFIRLAMVYIIVYLIAHLKTVLDSIASVSSGGDTIQEIMLKLVLIFGLLIFAKEAPKFVTDALGIKADLTGGIGLRSKLDKGGVFAIGSAVGAIGANVASGTLRGLGDATNKFHDNNYKTGLGRGLAAFGTGLLAPAKGIGQGLRSSKRAIFEARGPHAPHDFREMMNIIKDNNASTKAAITEKQSKKEAKKRDIENSAGLEEGDNFLTKMAKKAEATRRYNTDQFKRKVGNFAGVARDTSYYTEQLKNAADFVDISKLLGSTVDNADDVQMSILNEERKRGKETTMRLAAKVAKDEGLTAEEVLNRKDLMDRVYQLQNEEILEAKQKTKETRARVIRENLAAAAAGGKGNATSVKLKELLDSHREMFVKHRKDRMADGRTLEQTLNDMFGEGVLTGDVDFARAAGGGNMDIDVTGKDGKGTSQTVRVRMRSDKVNGKTETKYIYYVDGKEYSASSLEHALQGLGIAETTSSKAHGYGSASSRQLVPADIQHALSGSEIELADGSKLQINADGEFVDEALRKPEGLKKALADGKGIHVTDKYLAAMENVADGQDFEMAVVKDGSKQIIRYNAAKGSYTVIRADGTEQQMKNAGEVYADSLVEGSTIQSCITYDVEKASIVDELKTTGTQTQNVVLSSSEYQDAMRNKPASSGGGNK